MSNTVLKWEEVGIANDFMFGKVMQDPKLCKRLLQVILPELDIERVEYPELQKSIAVDKDAHSVRLDVYVKDQKDVVYNIEIQTTDTGELPRRSRYYQGMIDLQLLDKGESYRKLNRSYVIFICTFDLFGAGFHRYEFENLCTHDTNIRLNDGTTKIFLNAAGTADDVGEDLTAFLNYVAGKKSENDFVQKLEEAVAKARKNREWRHEYMTLAMRDQENIERGRKEEIIFKICKKLQKGKSMEVIADELEEPLESVQDVCKVASNFAPDYDHVKVIDMWFAKEKMK